VVYESLKRKGVEVSLSTVHRVLKRNNLIRTWSPWKKRHTSVERPKPLTPGALVELDTIHLIMKKPYVRLYVYTLIDVYSRWAYAEVSTHISAAASVAFVRRAQAKAPFTFAMMQSDHGSEFSPWFTTHIGAAHRHTRVRKPNDNAHVERFNRSIQDECLREFPVSVSVYQREIPRYLARYNGERLHMGINYLTPVEKLATVFPS
jgi:transposase InsO family protein